MVEAESSRSASPAKLARQNSPDLGRGTSIARFSQVGKKVAAGVKLNNAMAEEAKGELRNSQAKGDPNNVRVGLRCRPLSKMELGLGEESIAEFSPPQLCLTNPSPEKSDKPENYLFTYDFVYDSTVSTETVFQDMGAPLVEKLFDGLNGTLFAYGQTGSGKTYSMMGSQADPGVIPKVVAAIFEKCAALPEGVSVTVRASYLQIYREVLQDLSSPKGGVAEDLKIRRDPKLGTYVQGLTETELTTPEQLAALIDEGNKRRATATTLMNAESSRSHAVVVVKVEQHTEATRTRTSSKINLVDLAGSERASKTGASGETLKEAISINQSLSALGNVINALTDTKFKGHIPYRSSKLTHLLEESLGGNSTTVMLAAMSPAGRNFSETLNTLQYAERAKKIVTKVHANVEVEVARRKSFFEARDGDAAGIGGGDGGGAAKALVDEDLARFRAAQELASQAAQEELQSLRVERRESITAYSAATSAQVSLSAQLGEARASLADAERLHAQAVADAGVERGTAAEALAAVRANAAAALEEARAEAAEARSGAQLAATRAAASIEQGRGEAAAEAARLEAALEQERIGAAAAVEERKTVTSELQMLRLELASSQARGAAAAERREEEAITAAATEQALRASLESKDQERAAALEALHTRHAAELKERQQAQQAREDAQQLQMETQRKAEARDMLSRLETAAAAQARHQAEEQARALQLVQSQVHAQLQQLQTDQADGLKLQAGSEAEGLAALTRSHEIEMARRSEEVAAAEQRARAQAARLEEQQRLLSSAHEAQQASLQTALLAAQAEQVRLHGDNATRRGAADALGERVALLQEQVASAQLDLEQSRHAAIAEKAHLESELRERQEDLEVARVEGLSATHEAERLRAQLADKTAALQKLHAVYERTVQETRRVEDEAQAERHALHSERRQLELRLQEESRRAQKAVESLEKLKREGLLGRLFSGGDDSNGDSHAQAKSLPVRLPPDAGRESRV